MNLEDFKKSLGITKIPGHCFSCKKPFTEDNVYSDAGWRETKISGMCEKCFDETCKEEE